MPSYRLGSLSHEPSDQDGGVSVRTVLALTVFLTFACAGQEGSTTEASLATNPASTTSAKLQPSTTVPTSVTKAEYIAQANRICADANAQTGLVIDEIGKALPDQPTEEQVADAVVEMNLRMTPIVNSSVIDLMSLPRPAADEAELGSLWSDAQSLFTRLEQLVNDAAAGDQAALSRLLSDEDPEDFEIGEVNQRAVRYGLTECS